MSRIMTSPRRLFRSRQPLGIPRLQGSCRPTKGTLPQCGKGSQGVFDAVRQDGHLTVRAVSGSVAISFLEAHGPAILSGAQPGSLAVNLPAVASRTLGLSPHLRPA